VNDREGADGAFGRRSRRRDLRGPAAVGSAETPREPGDL
jgi:hypothetical protein